MNKLSNLLSEMTILTEANEDDLFDIDKEVDAQIKRVTNRVERKQQEQESMSQEDQQEQEISDSQEEEVSDNTTEEPIDDNTEMDNQYIDQEGEESPQEQQSDDYEYIDNGSTDTVPENYEPKQTIPELRILSTLSDSEYALCNIKIIEQFKELQNNVESTINNILMNITTRNERQVQIVEIVHDNLLDMVQDISTYILYRNNNIYEENVRTYLTYLKRYDIAMKLIRAILDENSKSDKK